MIIPVHFHLFKDAQETSLYKYLQITCTIILLHFSTENIQYIDIMHISMHAALQLS